FLFENPADGRVKLFVTSRALRFRRAHRVLFAQGDYIPLRATGIRRRHVLAFARNLQGRTVIAMASRFFMALNTAGGLPLGRGPWGDSALLLRRRLPSGRYRDVLTDTAVETVPVGSHFVLPLADVFSRLPVALLTSDEG